MKLCRILLLTICAYALISCGGAEERKAVYLEKARLSMEAGNYDKARVELKNVLQIDPKDGEAHYHMGKIFGRLKEYRKAYREYIKAEELSPELLDNHARLGQFYLLLLNDKDKAQEKVDLILSKEPNNSAGLLLTAAIEVKNKNKDKAIKIVKDIIGRDPKHIDSITFLALMHIDAKKYNDAIDLLDTVLKDEKSNEEINKLLASALMLNKDYDRAELLYKDFLNENPDSSSSYNNLASFYNTTGDFTKAKELFLTSYNNKPDDNDRLSILIKYIMAKEGEEKAIEELKKLIAQYSNQGNLRLALGELYVLNGDKQITIETYQKVIEDFSEGAIGVTARAALASIYISDKNYDKAESIIEDALSISHNDPDVNFLNAKFAIINKDFEKAIISLRIVTKQTPENIEAFVLLAKIYKSEGNDEQVKSTLNSAYSNNRSNAGGLLTLSKYYLSIDTKQAEKIIDDYNFLKEDDYEGLSVKSAILNKGQMYDKAFEIAEKLIELFPDRSNGYLQSLAFLNKQGDKDKAITILEKGYINAKDNRKILLILTSLQASNKQFDIVEKRINAELQQKPNDVELMILDAKIALAKGESSKAIEKLESITIAHNGVDEPYLLLANRYLMNNNKAKEKEVLLRGNKSIPTSLQIVLRLTAVYERDKEYDMAINTYKVLNKSKPNNLLVVNNLVSLLTDYGSDSNALDQALELSKKLEELKQPVFMDTIGWLHYKRKNYDNAIKYLSQAVTKQPDIGIFNYHLGMAYKMSGDTVNARTYLEKSVVGSKAFQQKELVQRELNSL